MKKITSILCIVLVIALMLPVFSGCTPSEGPATEEEGATRIKLWARSFEDWADNLLQKQVDEFNQIMDDGIQVDLQFYGDDSTYDTAIAAGFENGTIADIFMTQYDRIYTY